jgi:hypothetical protein
MLFLIWSAKLVSNFLRVKNFDFIEENEELRSSFAE